MLIVSRDYGEERKRGDVEPGGDLGAVGVEVLEEYEGRGEWACGAESGLSWDRGGGVDM